MKIDDGSQAVPRPVLLHLVLGARFCIAAIRQRHNNVAPLKIAGREHHRPGISQAGDFGNLAPGIRLGIPATDTRKVVVECADISEWAWIRVALVAEDDIPNTLAGYMACWGVVSTIMSVASESGYKYQYRMAPTLDEVRATLLRTDVAPRKSHPCPLRAWRATHLRESLRGQIACIGRSDLLLLASHISLESAHGPSCGD